MPFSYENILSNRTLNLRYKISGAPLINLVFHIITSYVFEHRKYRNSQAVVTG